MSKQDRQGVRTPADIERKYNLAALNNLHPVGSIYLTMAGDNPSELFGGTWQQMGYGKLAISQESADGELGYLDGCYIWKRTS